VPSLYSNIEEGITDSKTQSNKNSSTKNWKGYSRFSDKNSASCNSDFRKVNMSARLLLKRLAPELFSSTAQDAIIYY
jgi:hypothetical protein